jgi:hypothetical protein
MISPEWEGDKTIYTILDIRTLMHVLVLLTYCQFSLLGFFVLLNHSRTFSTIVCILSGTLELGHFACNIQHVRRYLCQLKATVTLLQRHGQRVHHASTSINSHLRARDVATKTTGQKPSHTRHFVWSACSLKPNRPLLYLLILQRSRRELAALHLFQPTALQINSNIDLSSGNGVDTNACALENRDSRFDNSKRRMRSHSERWGPATAVRASNRGNDYDGSVRYILRRSVRIATFGRSLLHCSWCILECKESRHSVRFEGGVEVLRASCVDRGWT